MNELQISNFPVEGLNEVNDIITPALLDTLKAFTSQDQRFDALRAIIYGRLNHLSRQIIQDSAEWREMDIESKCKVVGEIQECFYDLQLVEHACQKPLFTLAQAVFALNKKRCSLKTSSTISKSKPPKKRKIDALIRDVRRSERDVKSPSVATAIGASDEASNLQNDVEISSQRASAEASATTMTRRRGYNRDKTTNNTNITNNTLSISNGLINNKSSNDVFSRESASLEKDLLRHDIQSTNVIGVANDNDEKGDSNIIGCFSAAAAIEIETKCESIVENTVSSSSFLIVGEKCKDSNAENLAAISNSLESGPPKRRAAALAAAVSVAETVNPQRSSSPRKRNAAGNSNKETGDDGSGDGGGASSSSAQDEPTYCLCEQISFGDMICCDYAKCPIEWFHFSCVNIKLKPKGKKWFCPLCRGDKPTILKASLQSRR